MNVICALFGHRPVFGYGNSEGNGYFRQRYDGIDGIRRAHATLHCECERCFVEYQVGKIHILSVEELTERVTER